MHKTCSFMDTGIPILLWGLFVSSVGVSEPSWMSPLTPSWMQSGASQLARLISGSWSFWGW